jgi:uncharacterized membrane-anchored protein
MIRLGLASDRSARHIEAMPDHTRKKRPRDANQLGKMIVDISVGDVEDRGLTAEEQGKDAAAVSLGRRGGLKGGKARARALTPEQRAEIARVASSARWKKK